MSDAVANSMADGDGPETVDVPETAATCEAVVRFLVGWLTTKGQLPAVEFEPVVARVLRRESLGSTGIGRGFAIPHTVSAAIDKAAFVVGRLSVPLDWNAIDRVPVGKVALVIGPGSGPPDSPRALEAALRRLRGHFGAE